MKTGSIFEGIAEVQAHKYEIGISSRYSKPIFEVTLDIVTWVIHFRDQ